MYCFECYYGCCEYSGYCATSPDPFFCDYNREKVYEQNVGGAIGGALGGFFGLVIIIAIIIWCRRRHLAQSLGVNQINGNQTTIIMTNNQPAYGVQPTYQPDYQPAYQPTYNQPMMQPVYQPAYQPTYNPGYYAPNQGPIIIQS